MIFDGICDGKALAWREARPHPTLPAFTMWGSEQTKALVVVPANSTAGWSTQLANDVDVQRPPCPARLSHAKDAGKRPHGKRHSTSRVKPRRSRSGRNTHELDGYTNPAALGFRGHETGPTPDQRSRPHGTADLRKSVSEIWMPADGQRLAQQACKMFETSARRVSSQRVSLGCSRSASAAAPTDAWDPSFVEGGVAVVRRAYCVHRLLPASFFMPSANPMN